MGPAGEQRYSGGRMVWRLWAWSERWGHWTTTLLRCAVMGNYDMLFARTRQKRLWQDECRPYIDEIMSCQIIYTTQGEVQTPWVCNDINLMCLFSNWLVCGKDMSFERRMRHRLRMAESVFANRHNTEPFETAKACINSSRAGGWMPSRWVWCIPRLLRVCSSTLATER